MRRASSRGRPRISMLPYRGIETSRLVTGTKGRCKFVVADGARAVCGVSSSGLPYWL